MRSRPCSYRLICPGVTWAASASSRTVIPRSWRYSFKRCPMCVSTELLRSMGIILVRSPLYFILRAKFASHHPFSPALRAALSLGVAPLDPTVNFAEIVRLSVATEHHHRDYRYTCWSHYQNDVRLAAANPFRCQADRSPTLNRCLAGNQRSRRSTRRSPLGSFLAQRDS